MTTEQRIEGFPLSPQQRRVWRLQAEDRPFVTQGVYRIAGPLDRDRLRGALRDLVTRHEILRTRFPRLPGMQLPVQVIEEGGCACLREAEGPGTGGIARHLEAERAPFDLAEGPLGRFLLVHEGPDRHALVLTVSALVADRRSLDNLARELAALYEGSTAAAPPADVVQYADFADWQNELLADEEAAERRRYWRRVSMRPMRLDWLRAQPGAPAADEPAGALHLTVPPAVVDGLEDLARDRGVSLPTVLLGGCHLLLGLVGGEAEPLVGHLADGRRIDGLGDAVGVFGRYLPLRVPLPPDLRAAELVEAVERGVREGEMRQEVFSFEDLAAGAPEAPVFQVLFDYRDVPPSWEADGLAFEPGETCDRLESFELRLSAARGEDGLSLALEVDPARFGAADARRFLDRYRTVLEGLAAAPESPAASIEVRSPDEIRALEEWNRTESDEVPAAALHRLFEAQVRRSPDAEAVVAADAALTFAELDRRANRLARYLRRAGLPPEGRVMVALERSADQLVALLAVLKAGGLFIPLDPAQPAVRLAGMVEDVCRGAGRWRPVLVAGRELAARLPTVGARVLDLDAEAAAVAAEDAAAPDLEVDPDQLAYALFTSGSTGRPKAVAVRHRSVVNLWAALRRPVFGEDDDGGPRRVSLNAPLTFDASVKHWVQLLSGRTVVVVPEEVRADGERLRTWLAERRVDALDVTPSQLRLLAEAGFLEAPARERPAVVLVGGEAVSPELWQRLAAVPGTAFHDVYGPTECTVDATAAPLDGDPLPTIGRPLANVRVHVAGPALRPAPLGVPGELCVAGAGLARGYLDRPAPSAEKFLPDPFATAPGRRLYRTGDRARVLEDGRLEFLGRLDHQVKLRGVRVELGEIEALLSGHPAVREAVVDLRTDGAGGETLAAYLVPKVLGDRGGMRDWLGYRLPDGRRLAAFDQSETEYMVREIFERRCYLPEGISLRPGAVVFDVGANVGLFSLFVAEEVPAARIYAFEPVPAIFEALRHNARLHFPSAELYPFGLSDAEAAAEFTFYPRFSARSGLAAYAHLENEIEITRRYVRNLGGEESAELAEEDLDELLVRKLESELVACRLRRLSDVIREAGVEEIDLLKIDVQRAELDVLRGIDDEHWARIRQVAMEVHDAPGTPSEGRLAEIGTLLRRHGFEVVVSQEEVLAGTDRHFLRAARSDAGAGKGGAGPAAGAAPPAGRHHYRRLPNGLEVVHRNANETEFVYRQIFEDRTYLRHGIELQPGAVVFDAGANIGLFSLFVHLERPDATIYAFEPVPSTFALLRENLARHGVSAIPFEAGLADREGEAELVFYPGWTAASGFYADEEQDESVARRFLLNRDDELAIHAAELAEGRFRSERLSGRLTTVSRVVRDHGIERIDLLKADVEKSELDLLRGIDEEDWPKIRQVVLEVHDLDGRLDAIRSLLGRHGFRVAVVQDALAARTGLYTLYATHGELGAGRPRAAGGAQRPDEALTETALRSYLRERIPELMVPSAFVILDRLPYNRNGKVDRSALPAPTEAEARGAGSVAAPRTPAEEVLVGLFGEVLDRERLGVDESFFDLGGHSLLATQLMSRVREALQADIPLRVLFEAPTPAALARAAEPFRGEQRSGTAPRLEPVPRGGPLPLSFSQQSLWLLQQLEPESSSYNSLKALRIRGSLDPAVVAAVLSEVVRRHEVLRTRFPEVDGEPLQWIEPPALVPLPVVDLAGLRPERREEVAAALARREARRPFDLAAETPLRPSLVRLGGEHHVLLVGLHHIAVDGWSLAVLDREVDALYRAFSAGATSPLPELPVQYADYAAWQRAWLAGDVLEREIDFWRRRLAGAPAETTLPRDRPSGETGRRSGTRALVLPQALSRDLARVSREQGSTLYLTLLAGFFALLHHSTGEDDLVVGTATAGRELREVEDLVGVFINMLPMRVDLSDDPTFRTLLARVRHMGLDAYVHQALPFEKLVEALGHERRPGRNPIFQIAFGVSNAPLAALDLPGLAVEAIEVEHEEPRLDLTVWMRETPEGLRTLWTFDRSRFSGRTIERLEARLVTVLRHLVESPDVRVRDADVLGEGERGELEEHKCRRESSNLRRLREARRREIGVS